ncbi:HSP20-like chaperone [Microdochium trichocladiopsis]|uniref:HSP20-like chaperone n=1 Tax=Microdochium trichocladiopsis TaxID=1682393 RepID=A0A9P8YBB9_9PEZI|nr:HSP20-like chaperone [Microdochium trichocladiopsis]KAH7034914.1 HSP20-like chaperone [Microdochium trichocladiopsis]
MAFFRPHVYSAPYAQPEPAAEPSFHGLFRLLEDWDNHHSSNAAASTGSNNNSSSNSHNHPRKRPHLSRPQHKEPIFTPRFDVKETESTYELFGDLPGVKKQDINIEFSDPQTLVVSGRVERTPAAADAPSSKNLLTSDSHSDHDDDDAVMISHHEDEHAETSSQRSFRATVEDDTEETGTTSTPAATSKKSEQHATASTAEKQDLEQQQQQQQPKTPATKFWISERPHGTFSRTFAFPERLDLDGVTAGLENGVLSLVVPKARKYEAKRISLL